MPLRGIQFVDALMTGHFDPMSLSPILSQMNPVHALTHFFKIHFSIYLQHRPTYLKWALPSSFLNKILYDFLTSLMRATRPAHLIFLDTLPNNSWQRIKM